MSEDATPLWEDPLGIVEPSMEENITDGLRRLKYVNPPYTVIARSRGVQPEVVADTMRVLFPHHNFPGWNGPGDRLRMPVWLYMDAVVMVNSAWLSPDPDERLALARLCRFAILTAANPAQV